MHLRADLHGIPVEHGVDKCQEKESADEIWLSTSHEPNESCNLFQRCRNGSQGAHGDKFAPQAIQLSELALGALSGSRGGSLKDVAKGFVPSAVVCIAGVLQAGCAMEWTTCLLVGLESGLL